MSNLLIRKDRTYWINFVFNCNSQGVVYLIICKQCSKLYVGSTITSFTKRFNNHKSSVNRNGKGIAGEHLYSHFILDGHNGVEDMLVKIIDKTDIRNIVKRQAFWAYKLNTFVLSGLNIRDFT